MRSLHEVTDALRATQTDVGGRTVPARFARPERAHLAVRAGVGVTVHPWGVLEVAGDDRRSFLGDTLTCRLPEAENAIVYGLLLDPDGRIEADCYVADVGDAFLCLTSPGTAGPLAETLGSHTFIQDVSVTDRTDDHAVIGLHGPAVETKLSSVFRRGRVPRERLTVGRGVLRDEGVTALRLDAPAGEPGVAIVARAAAGGEVFDGLVSLGSPAAPFGYDTWIDLTLEAGTPLFETELAGRQATVCGQVGGAVDLEKGCFVGQEAVARVTNLAAPRERLVGLHLDADPDAATAVRTDEGPVGELTRVCESPVLEAAIAFAVVGAEATTASLSVGDDGVGARVARLPFVEGTEPSGRRPRFDA
ncbi:MAG: glycine cleavage T C-terminal barrel domain-containing protein [Halobacteriales archaeon]